MCIIITLQENWGLYYNHARDLIHYEISSAPKQIFLKNMT